MEFQFERTFGPHEYRSITKALFGTGSPSSSYIHLDLSGVEYSIATGIVPLIALIKNCRAAGADFEIQYPEDLEFWQKVGWWQVIEEMTPPGIEPGRSYIPIQAFRSQSELNEAVNGAVEVLARHMDCAAGVIDSAAWTLNELADNVLNHSQPEGIEATGLLQIVSHPQTHLVDIVVSDWGQGIRQSLWESHLTTSDEDAIAKALEKGITRNPDKGQGNGLAGSVRIVTSVGGELSVMSGNGELSIKEGDTHSFRPGLVPGTTVYLTLPTMNEVDLGNALWGSAPMGAFEMSHLDDDLNIVFMVAEEADGFGNRASGEQLRRKLTNLMVEHSEARVLVDFEGVPLVTASFADEFLAKTAVQMGLFNFFDRIHVKNATAFIKQTLNEVTNQRASNQ